jgi:hypothetical protein
MRRLVAFTLSFAAGACSLHHSALSRTSAVGDWTLKSVNGHPLPFTIGEQGQYKSELVSVALHVDPNGSFVFTPRDRESMGGQVSEKSNPDPGTYVLTGTLLALRFASDGKTYTATMNGNTLTLVQRGGTYVFTR